MRVQEFDLNGVSDGDSMIKIIKYLNPKTLIFVNGTSEDNTTIKAIFQYFNLS